jgi:hypothetical protein
MLKVFFSFCLVLLGCAGCKNNNGYKKAGFLGAEKELFGAENIAYQWGKLALKATANNTEQFRPRPTITSRYLGLIFTAIFDAWSRYDEKAIPVYLKGVERKPAGERNLENKSIAISFASFRAMTEYYYTDSVMFKVFMIKLGFNPNNQISLRGGNSVFEPYPFDD